VDLKFLGTIAVPGSDLAKRIVSDFTKIMPVGIAGGLSQMVRREDGSDVFHLYWDSSKLGLAMLGAFIASTIVGLIRYCMWRRSHPEALD